MNVENIKKWLVALRSGEYKQAKRHLKVDRSAGGFGYCCLGLACDLHSKETKHDWIAKATGHYYFNNRKGLPSEVQDWLGLPASEYAELFHILVWMNDAKGKTFKEIADHIEYTLFKKDENK